MTFKFTPEQLRQAQSDLNDLLRERQRKAAAKLDEAARAKAKDPCPFWSDGAHCYAPGFVTGGGAFVTDRPMHMNDAKQCKCGARVRPARGVA